MSVTCVDLRDPLFHQTVLLLTGQRESTEAYLAINWPDDDSSLTDLQGMVTRQSNGTWVCWVGKRPVNWGVVVHELAHLTWGILLHMDIPPRRNTEEIYARLLEHFYRQCQDVLPNTVPVDLSDDVAQDTGS